MMGPLNLLVTSIFTLALSACGGNSAEAQGKPFNVSLSAMSDDGLLLEGVRISAGGTALGTTDDRGRLLAVMRGSDGDSVPIGVTCPEGYLAPEDQPNLRLAEVRHVNQPDLVPLNLETICIRRMREIAIVVHAANGPALPVGVGGKTMATTDLYGNAHVRLDLDRDVRQLSVSLDTASAPTLRPQNPSRVFELDGKDAVLIVDQAFIQERKRGVRRQVAVATKIPKDVPYRIGKPGGVSY